MTAAMTIHTRNKRMVRKCNEAEEQDGDIERCCCLADWNREVYTTTCQDHPFM
jgi:hypothetical protein